MRTLFLLFAAILVTGCGEKKSGLDGLTDQEKKEFYRIVGEGMKKQREKELERVPEKGQVRPSPLLQTTPRPISVDGISIPFSPSDISAIMKTAVSRSSFTSKNGLARERQYLGGTPYTGWFYTGNPNSLSNLGYLKDGWRHGPYTSWHRGYKADDGGPQKCGEMNYKMGKPHGRQQYWSHTGSLSQISICVDGKQVSAQAWDENGREIKPDPD